MYANLKLLLPANGESSSLATLGFLHISHRPCWFQRIHIPTIWCMHTQTHSKLKTDLRHFIPYLLCLWPPQGIWCVSNGKTKSVSQINQEQVVPSMHTQTNTHGNICYVVWVWGQLWLHFHECIYYASSLHFPCDFNTYGFHHSYIRIQLVA